MKKKRCSCCEARKPLDDFNNDKTTKDGKKYQCRDCTKKNRPSRAGQPVYTITPPEIVSERITNKCMERWWV